MTTIITSSQAVFACHSAACRPPTSGGTGGSNSRGGSRGKASTPRASKPPVTPVPKTAGSKMTDEDRAMVAEHRYKNVRVNKGIGYTSDGTRVTNQIKKNYYGEWQAEIPKSLGGGTARGKSRLDVVRDAQSWVEARKRGDTSRDDAVARSVARQKAEEQAAIQRVRDAVDKRIAEGKPLMRRIGGGDGPHSRYARRQYVEKMQAEAQNKTQIKDGAVHLNGQKITGVIRKSNGLYKATLRDGAEPVLGRTRHELAQEAARRIIERSSQRAIAADKSRFTDRDSGASLGDVRRVQALNATHTVALSKHGAVKPSDITIGRDGTTKIKGQAEPIMTVQKVGSGWLVNGIVKNGRGTTYKTQAQARAAIAKVVTAVAKMQAPSAPPVDPEAISRGLRGEGIT